LTAFRLSMGKALVPFMFTYTPALLFVDFTWGAVRHRGRRRHDRHPRALGRLHALVGDGDHARRAGRADRSAG